MQVLSHRGFHEECPENTMEAFDRAVRLGVDGIELDVRISADALPIVFHDRVAPDGRPVSSLTRRQLSAAVGFQVPILDEALGTWPDLAWNVEIKTPDASDATIAAVEKGPVDIARVLITSFHHPVAEYCGARLDVRCGVLAAHRPIDAAAFISTLKARFRLAAVVWDYEVVDTAVMEIVSSLGVDNFVYGPHTPDEHRRLSGIPVAGIITDRPDFVRLDETGSRR